MPKVNLGRWLAYTISIGLVVFVYLYAQSQSRGLGESPEKMVADASLAAPSPLTKVNLSPVTSSWQNAPIVLTGLANETGVVLYWKTNGLEAPLGFKVVEGIERSPAYPLNNYVDLADNQTRIYTWPITDGQVHYFRVCQSLVNGDCGKYSNNLWLRTKNKQSP